MVSLVELLLISIIFVVSSILNFSFREEKVKSILFTSSFSSFNISSFSIYTSFFISLSFIISSISSLEKSFSSNISISSNFKEIL